MVFGHKDGRFLRDFRAAYRRFFGEEDVELEDDMRRLGDTWLAFTASHDEQGTVEDEVWDMLVEECVPLHRQMLVPAAGEAR